MRNNTPLNGHGDFFMKSLRFLTLCSCLLLACLAFDGCNDKSADIYEPTFAPDTSGNETLVWGFPSFSYCENAELIVKYLNKRLSGAHIVVKACVNWDEYVSQLNQNKFDISSVNGIQAVDATLNDYTIFGKIMDDTQYSAVIVTRKDEHIKEVSDLKGKSIAFAPSRMVPGTMLPLYYLCEHGLNVNSDIKKVPVSSFESAIISTNLGKSDAGLCLKRNWLVYVRDHPEVLSNVELKWETPSLINNAMIINNKTDKKLTDQLLVLLFSMHTNKEGKEALALLNISGFEKASNETYKPVLDFKKKYDAVIH
jgi:phosphonate transport system substrate-binding protein